MPIGAPPELCAHRLKEEDIMQVKKNPESSGRDRLANDEEEVFIFILPGCNKMR
jgi:hypothetical protein